jgi:hypothetical protein
MKQRDFNAFRGSEAERFSGSQFHDAVQTLDNARRNGAFGPEPVEEQVSVTPQALGPGLNVHLVLGGSSGGYDQSFPLGDERIERLDVIVNTLEVCPAVRIARSMAPPHRSSG